MAQQYKFDARKRAERDDSDANLAAGTIIYTLDGALPVEFLTPGDRIITRRGARVLRTLDAHSNGFTLGFDAPEMFYADGVETLAA